MSATCGSHSPTPTRPHSRPLSRVHAPVRACPSTTSACPGSLLQPLKPCTCQAMHLSIPTLSHPHMLTRARACLSHTLTRVRARAYTHAPLRSCGTAMHDARRGLDVFTPAIPPTPLSCIHVCRPISLTNPYTTAYQSASIRSDIIPEGQEKKSGHSCGCDHPACIHTTAAFAAGDTSGAHRNVPRMNPRGEGCGSKNGAFAAPQYIDGTGVWAECNVGASHPVIPTCRVVQRSHQLSAARSVTGRNR